MGDGVDPMIDDHAADGRLVAHVGDDQGYAIRHRPAKAGRKVIEHHDILSGVEELQHHVAADVSGAARDQHRHCSSSVAVTRDSAFGTLRLTGRFGPRKA